MNITKEQIKETIKELMSEDSGYKAFFKKALEKAGKSIPSMSDEEKKAFFNKIDNAWDAKGEKNEALKGDQHKLDVDGDGEIEASDLAALRAGKTAEDDVNEEKPGLWANIRAKKARGEKPAHGNSQAHKDAVKAGKAINKKNESVGCGCGCGGCSTSLSAVSELVSTLSEELAFEVATFIDRPIIEGVLTNKKTTKDVVGVLVSEGITNVLTDSVKSEFDTLIQQYK